MPGWPHSESSAWCDQLVREGAAPGFLLRRWRSAASMRSRPSQQVAGMMLFSGFDGRSTAYEPHSRRWPAMSPPNRAPCIALLCLRNERLSNHGLTPWFCVPSSIPGKPARVHRQSWQLAIVPRACGLAKRDTLAHVHEGSTCLLGALSVHAWCGDTVPMGRVGDDGFKPTAAFVT